MKKPPCWGGWRKGASCVMKSGSQDRRSEMPLDDQTEIEFDEAWYLARNLDVLLKKDGGHWESGLAHYLAHGRNEGRKPRPDYNYDLEAAYTQHNGGNYLSPTELSFSETTLRGAAIIGSCLMNGLHAEFQRNTTAPIDMFLVNGASSPPELMADEIAAYDFQVVQVPLRSVISDDAFIRLSRASPAECEKALTDAAERLAFLIKRRMAWNETHGLLT